MPDNSNKRQLDFQNIDEMVHDMDVLLSRGYTMKGNWNLAQSCLHVNEWMRFPMDGFPKPPAPIRIMLWLMKVTIGPGMKRKIMAEGFKSGMMTDPKTVPGPNDVSDEEAARTLRETAIRLNEFDGQLYPSPLFGSMEKGSALRVSLMHASHHFGFLHPN